MRTPRPLVIVLAALLAATFLAPIPSARASASLPTWHPGDSWTYRGYGVGGLSMQPAQVNMTVTGTEDVPENGTVVSAYRTTVWMNLTGVAPVHVADEWFRTSDLAIARLVLYYYKCPYSPAGVFCSNDTVTVTPEPPLPIQFPLTTGDAWSASTWIVSELENRDTGATYWINYTGGANATVGVDFVQGTPAGNLSATLLTVDYSQAAALLLYSFETYSSSRATVAFSPVAGNAALIVEYTASSSSSGQYNPVLYLELVSWSHATPWYAVGVLGLPVWSWFVIVAAAAAVAVIVVLRRRRPKPAVAKPHLVRAARPPPGPPPEPP